MVNPGLWPLNKDLVLAGVTGFESRDLPFPFGLEADSRELRLHGLRPPARKEK